jgi:nitroreductase/Pyruvate/2-oxoacid:ferredoxin oxidoreductase delta subunit
MILERLRKGYLPGHPELWSNPEIVIDEEKCTGCGNCTKACPMLALEVVRKKCRFTEEAVCFGCSACVAACKEDAIKMNTFYNVSQGVFKTMSFHPQDGYPDPPDVEGIEGLTPVEEVIYSRRSNRIYKKDPVPDALLRRVIEAGRFAPSAANGQPWSFLVINDREEMDELAKLVSMLFKPLTRLYKAGETSTIMRCYWAVASAVMPKLFDQRAMRGGLKTIQPLDVFLGAPALIVILGDKRGISNMDLDCGIMAQNMVLAAHSLGLATCYISFLIAASEFNPLVRRKLRVKWPYKPVCAMVLGYPRVKVDSRIKREQPRITWRKGGKEWAEMP